MERMPLESAGSGEAYERRDMSARVIGRFLGVLVGAVIVVFGLMWWMFDVFAANAARREVPPSPLAEAQQVSPAPNLQVTPRQDLKVMRGGENALLHSYGWVDQKAGLVRIPIDRAMQLLVERGLPKTDQKAGQ